MTEKELKLLLLLKGWATLKETFNDLNDIVPGAVPVEERLYYQKGEAMVYIIRELDNNFAPKYIWSTSLSHSDINYTLEELYKRVEEYD